MASRRNFIRTTTLGITAATFYPLINKGESAISKHPASASELPVGIADFTFRHFDIPQSIQMMQRLDIHSMSIKDFHLPLNSTKEKIDEVVKQYRDGDVTIYAVGVIYMKDKDAVDQAFDYARNVGVDIIVGVPNHDLIDYAEQKVKDYNIKLAIHNHGPEDKLYPNPQIAYDLIKNKDARMGLCLDIGHAQRAGVVPAKAVLKYGKRIFDLHIKDVTKAENDGKAIEIGRGIIDFPSFVKALRKIKYPGHCSIEFEKDMKDPLPGIAESIGYFKGVKAGTV
ncbi:MAG: sugar phosphate isomerase/epimerase family protein [Bacteroidota bacterium]|nr:sugar phosphate isomerase/epimerase family protein [Bacteroidota bacterium]